MGTWRRLERWAADGNRSPVAVVGAGFIGRGLVHRLHEVPGLPPGVVVNRDVRRAVEAYTAAGVAPDQVVVSNDPGALDEAIAEGRPAATGDADVLPSLETVPLVVEATGALDHGARVVLSALRAGKSVVSMNAELDATVGYLLHSVAREAGSVYTISDGDQPGVLLRQLELAHTLGLDVVAAVNCKRNLDVRQNPDDSRPYAERDGTSVLMTTAFGDGTKMQIENAVVANLTGLVPDVRGMHGVETTVERAAADVAAVLGRSGVVEYTLGGDFGGGVGVVVHADDPLVTPYLRYGKLGDGPYYFLFRPFHLLHLETPLTLADVVLDREPLGVPPGPPTAEAVAVAKRALAAGEQLDGIGGFCCYGHVEAADRASDLLPIGLAEHARLVEDVAIDEPVPLAAVELDESAEIVRLRRRQDELLRTAVEGSRHA